MTRAHSSFASFGNHAGAGGGLSSAPDRACISGLRPFMLTSFVLSEGVAVSKYKVVIVGAAGVWPPVRFDDYGTARAHATKVAKSLEGVNGSPKIQIQGEGGRVWTVDELLAVERFLSYFRNRRKSPI
jgi:hypothetical protein